LGIRVSLGLFAGCPLRDGGIVGFEYWRQGNLVDAQGLAFLPIVFDIGSPEEVVVAVQRNLVGITSQGYVVEEVLGDRKDFRLVGAAFDQLLRESPGEELEHLRVRMAGKFGGSIELFVRFQLGYLVF